MYWKSNGDYLAVKVDQHTITKKRCTDIHIFHITGQGINIKVLELEDKIISFSWDPKGHRFAVIHGESNPSQDISFYSTRSHNADLISKHTTLRGRKANALFWSPSGCFIILAELKKQMEFYNLDDRKTMGIEHLLVTDIEWDPTGRFVATAVTSVDGTENSFNIWSFNGKLLHRIGKGHFVQISWRPKPPSFISLAKEEINLDKRMMTPEVECFCFPVSPLITGLSDAYNPKSPEVDDAAAPFLSDIPALAQNARRSTFLRRPQNKWKPHEVQALEEGVGKYDKGNWKYILDSKPGVFEGRRAVDLKDKWRNLEKKKACP